MNIVPQFSVYFVNMLLVYWVTKAIRFTFLHPLSYRAIISMLSKVYFVVLRVLTNVDTDLRANRCSFPLSTFGLDDCSFSPSVTNGICITPQTKEIPFAITSQ